MLRLVLVLNGDRPFLRIYVYPLAAIVICNAAAALAGVYVGEQPGRNMLGLFLLVSYTGIIWISLARTGPIELPKKLAEALAHMRPFFAVYTVVTVFICGFASITPPYAPFAQAFDLILLHATG